MPEVWQRRAKFAFSERNPYPGWMASAPMRLAISTICFPSRKPLTGTGPDEIGLVSFFDVDAGGIGFGKDRRRRDIEFAAATDDPHGDFAAVGNQNFPKHDGIARGLEPASSPLVGLQKRSRNLA